MTGTIGFDSAGHGNSAGLMHEAGIARTKQSAWYTMRAFQVSEEMGAFAGLAMRLNGIFTAPAIRFATRPSQ